MKRLKYSRILALAPLAAIAAGLAVQSVGCSKDEPPPTKQQSLTIGFSVDLTGTNGAVGESLRKGAQTAVDLINSRGGVLGKSIILDVQDDKGNNVQKGDRGAFLHGIIDNFVNRGVTAILGPSSSVQFVDVIKTGSAATKRTLMLSAWSTSAEITEAQPPYPDRYVYRTVPSDSFQSRALYKLMTQGVIGACSKPATGLAAADAGDNDGGTSVKTCCKPYYVWADDPLGKSYNAYLKDKMGAVTVQTNNQGNFTTQINTLVAAQADCIAFTTYPDVAGNMIPQLVAKIKATSGYPAYTLIGTDATYTPDFVSEIKKRDPSAGTVENMIGVVPDTAPTGWGPYTDFTQIFKAQTGEVPGNYAANAFDAAILLALAVEKAQSSTDVTAIRDALVDVSRGYPGKVQNPPPEGATHVSASQLDEAFKLLKNGAIDYDGASGPVDFDDNGDTVGSYISWKITAGSFAPLPYSWSATDLQ